MKVEVYFDVVCPWCYIGERRLARALEAADAGAVELVFRPFQLDPAAPLEARPVAEYLARRFGAVAGAMQQRVSQVAAAEGIRIDWDRAQVTNTQKAHRLVQLASREYSPSVQRALVESLFSAHFTEGLDVGDDETLISIASASGIGPERAAEWLVAPEAESDVRAAIADAYELGVQSVPTFVFDERFALEGAQPIETFMRALETARDSTGAGAPDNR